MYRKAFLRTALGLAIGLTGVICTPSVFAQTQHDGSAAKPLRVILVPADGGINSKIKITLMFI